MSHQNVIEYPRVYLRNDQRVEVVVNFKNRRLRFQNGKAFDLQLRPNSYPLNQRLNQANILAAEIYSRLMAGYDPVSIKEYGIKPSTSDLEILKTAVDRKIKTGVSDHYERQLTYTLNSLTKEARGEMVYQDTVHRVLDRFQNATSYNTMRRSLMVLFNLAKEMGWDKNPMEGIKPKKAKAKLHKPIDNISELLNEIRVYNENLFLCCLLTYACLLRPHREIRELRWSDFDKDLSHIRLSGDRNKSGRNRVVPVPQYVQEFLKKNEDHLNIFSGKEVPYDKDYFKGLWGRFKKTSKLLKEDQTLYSFRHSGAIEIYKRTGSLEKLQTVMGHADLSVSLTYLRGLDVTDLKEEDMPRL